MAVGLEMKLSSTDSSIVGAFEVVGQLAVTPASAMSASLRGFEGVAAAATVVAASICACVQAAAFASASASLEYMLTGHFAA